MNKKILIAAILTFVVNILCIPLWTECGYGGFVRTLFNKEVRLEFVYSGIVTGSEPFHFQATPEPSLCSWFYHSGNIRRAHLTLQASGKWQKLSVQVEPLHDGKITISFKGPDARDDYGRCYSVLTDWRNSKINGKAVFKESKTLSYQKGESAKISVKKNEILQIEAEFRRHRFTIHDFIFLKHGNLWYLITGNLLTLFLIYRLLSYFAGRRERVRLGDALLVVTFFTCLFIPMIDISDEVKSQRENRTLAEKPTLKGLLKGEANTGGGYERWFNDHFYGRSVLIKLHDIVRNNLSHIIRTRRGSYFKEGGWDFGLPPLVDCGLTSFQAIVDNLVHLDQFCRKNRIKLYILEVPRKEIIYKEFIVDNYGFDEKQFVKVSRAEETIRREVRNTIFPGSIRTRRSAMRLGKILYFLNARITGQIGVPLSGIAS